METLTSQVSEFSDSAMMMYRTMLIKAELRRRRTLVEDRHRMIIADALPTAGPLSASIHDRNRSEMKRVFDLFDENKDGLISADELQVYMQRLGFNSSEQTVRAIVGSVDKNSDDLVDFDEFYSLYGSLSDEREKSCSYDSPISSEDDEEEESLIRAFFVFDENRDGLITASELQHVLLKLGIPEGRSLYRCTKMIERVDTDGNGKVDFFEFKNMMCSNDFSLAAAR